jgi:hypothetical protein
MVRRGELSRSSRTCRQETGLAQPLDPRPGVGFTRHLEDDVLDRRQPLAPQPPGLQPKSRKHG